MQEYSLSIRNSLNKNMAQTNLNSAKKAKNDEFYTQYPDGSNDGALAVLVEPEMGAAVVFNSKVWHEGMQVVSGVRHPYVASFLILIRAWAIATSDDYGPDDQGGSRAREVAKLYLA